MTKAKLIFRKATQEEERIVKNFLINEFDKKIGDELEKKTIYVKERGINEVYLVDKELKEVIEKLSSNSPKLYQSIFFAGYPIGSIQENQFYLEIGGGYYWRELIKKRITVKTQQFLYGKDIVVANVIDYSHPFIRGDWVTIYGKEKTGTQLYFGVGRTLLDSSDLLTVPPNTVIIKGYKKRPFDLGWFLRFEK